MIVLDTNVISALMLDRPDSQVMSWLDRQPAASVWTTSVSVFESRYGLLAMPDGRRKSGKLQAIEQLLNEVIQRRVLHFDEAAAEQAAALAADRHRRGRPGELRDTMIAGIVLANHAALATRNVKRFAELGKRVVSPWEAKA